MLRTLATVSTALFVLSAAKVACAERDSFPEKGQFILGVDRLVPVLSYSQTWTGHLGPLAGLSGQSTTTSQTSLSFFWGSTLPQETFFSVPRLGFDYVLAPHFTIGGEAVLFVTAGASSSTERDALTGGSTTTANPATTRTVFGIAPRVGYVVRLTDLLSLWLRGGLSFYTQSDKPTIGNNASTGVNQFALDLEPQLLITPFSHFGITIGPTLDLPLFGQAWADPNESAYSATFFFGVTAGMIVYF